MPEQFMPRLKNPQATRLVALFKNGRYSLAVAAKSATGLGNPLNNRRNSAHISFAGAFFASAIPFYGGCAWETFGSAGFLLSRFTNLRTAATHSLGNERGSSSTIGVSPHASPQSVQNPRRCTPCNGSRRSTRQFQPRYSSCPLQRPYGQSSRSRSRRRCPMNSSLSFALPEDLLCVSKDIEKGVPIDAITCAINRAESVLMLLEDHFESESDRPRLANHVLAAVIWDVRGTLGLIKTLTLHGDTTSVPMDQKGGAV
ncbi:hypothetical protein PflQ2_4621 [Pseudomonas fluorescens Q2-87]|uniref:Uncharacterized protein n=2 Tax=Pseudomonas fluorescens TaxID=294 RepID=J2EJD8_PSEFQ|nr:hypothetical protein PflQ2_4621 [Pseudomonas fluorescens Q2-87]